jgi:hypothetical protein
MPDDSRREALRTASENDRGQQGGSRERRVFPRYPFVADTEIVELKSGVKISARTSEISLGGCYIETLNPLLAGTAIRLLLRTAKGTFESEARIVYAHPGIGMGVAFLNTRDEQRKILEGWIEPVRHFLHDDN